MGYLSRAAPAAIFEKGGEKMGGEERRRETSQVVETRTQREIILDTLRQKFPEWGYDPRVPDWIINMGVVGLLKGKDKEIVGFNLKVLGARGEAKIKYETKLKYLHSQRSAEICVSHEKFREIIRPPWSGVEWEGERTYTNVQSITSIRLQERPSAVPGPWDTVLCIAGEVGGKYMEFYVWRHGPVEESLFKTGQ